MDLHGDLHDELETAIGHGPPLPAPLTRLAAGQRALRRRRALVAVGAATGVAAVVLPVAVLAGGSPTSGGELTPAAPPTSAAAPSPTATPEPEPEKQPRWDKGEYVRFDADGEVEVRPGVRVLDRVDDYLAGTRWEHSVALEVRDRGTVSWVTAEWDADEGTSSSGWTEANPGWADFRAYVSDQAAANGADGASGGGSGYPDLVSVSADGSLTAGPGARILEQRQDLGFPENFAPPGAPTAAAEVEHDGVRYLVLYRQLDGEDDLIPVPAAGHGDSLDALLDWARQRYESEEGVR